MMSHFISILAGFICPIIWKSLGGVIISLVYMIINIPFIIIQRYNRPRLIEVYDKRIARDRKDN